MRKFAIPAVAGVSMFLLAGATPQRTPVVPRALNPAVKIQVRNQNTADVDVYAVSGGQVTRLGMVTALSNRSLALPQSILSRGTDVHLMAEPIGGFGAYVSGPLLVSKGEVVVLRIGTAMPLSSVWTR